MTKNSLFDIVRKARNVGHRPNLNYVNLCEADLSGVNLSGVDLRGANLSDANLSGTDLSGADLRWANLSGAQLRGTNLHLASMRGTILCNADLLETNNIPHYTYSYNTILPEGTLIGWAKAKNEENAVTVKLKIPAYAKRSNSTGRLCRTNIAKVLALYKIESKEVLPPSCKAVAIDGKKCIYHVGKTVKSDQWDTNPWDHYSHGIYFFITRKEAEDYVNDWYENL